LLPVGEGLFAVSTVDEAVEAINSIRQDYAFHSKKALEVANDFFDSNKIIKKLLDEL
jgi:hypothetical protein